jgi:hypothetical protein
MKVARGIGFVAAWACGLSSAAVAPAGVSVFEVQVEIKAPSGEDLGKRRITTALDSEAAIEWTQGGGSMRLAVLVRRTVDPDCQQVSLGLERREAGEAAKETNFKAVACGDKPVRIEGDELGARSLTVTLKKGAP